MTLSLWMVVVIVRGEEVRRGIKLNNIIVHYFEINTCAFGDEAAAVVCRCPDLSSESWTLMPYIISGHPKTGWYTCLVSNTWVMVKPLGSSDGGLDCRLMNTLWDNDWSSRVLGSWTIPTYSYLGLQCRGSWRPLN